MAFPISRALLSSVLLAATPQPSSSARGAQSGFDLVDKSGNIRKPPNYRELYQSFGSYTVHTLNGEEEMHFTYASPGTAEYYRKTGKFPDGAVLVKETFGTAHGDLSTGDAHWPKGTRVWFVMVKDSKGRYPGNPLWGDGWGWALYTADAPEKQVATDYKQDCLGCHVPAKANDWIYVEGYPVLSRK